MKSKKAISLMVSYTLLIVIAISLSIIVYSYLKLELPSERKECPADTSLIIESAVCAGTAADRELNITLSNRGLFNISAAYIRMGRVYMETKTQINKDLEILVPSAIPPGQARGYSYDISDTITSAGDYTLEVQPAVFSKRVLVPCKTVITQSVNCPI